MAQAFAWTDDCYAGSHTAQTDMANIKNNLRALKCSFRGDVAPGNVEDGMRWHDSGSNCRKVRRNGNWVAILTGASGNTFKMWLYQNGAEDGWTIDSGVTDKVLSLKGGSAAYNRTGGGIAGNFVMSITAAAEAAHTHTVPAHHHTLENVTESVYAGAGNWTLDAKHSVVNAGHLDIYKSDNTGAGSKSSLSSETDTDGTCTSGVGSSHAHSMSHSTYRPAAAVGTLQYPDMG